MRPNNVLDHERARLPRLQTLLVIQTTTHGRPQLPIAHKQIHQLPHLALIIHLKEPQLHLTQRRHKHPQIFDRFHL